MRILEDKNSILDTMKLKTEVVKLNDKVGVIVSEMNSVDYSELWSSPEMQKDGQLDTNKFISTLITYCVLDKHGKRIFNEEDVAAIQKSSYKVFSKLSEAVRKLNGITGEETKNSGDNQD